MTGDRSQLINFVQKFLGMVKFGNDHVAKIMGYGDYQIGNVTISRVYYVEGLGHNLFSIEQFCDSYLEVAFRQHTCFIRNLKGVDLLIGSRGNNLYTLSLQDMMASSPICLLSKESKTMSWLWHRRLSHLNFGAINHLARQGLVREAVATACFTQNQSIIRLRHGNTPYELLHSKLPDLSFFHVFGALCYPTNNSENLGKLQPKADIGIFIGYAPTKKAFRIYNRRTRLIVETIHVDFDELTAMATEQSIDQDAPSPSKSLTPTETQSSVILQDVGNDNLDMEVAHMGNDSLLGVPFPEVTYEQSSSTASPQSNVQPNHPMTHHSRKWTNDHPLNNIIGQLSRPVSTRLQLHEQALFCYYDAFLTSMEPKTYKEALTQACWIEAMQEELNEFERL
nr:integrase, catalytic region, zinc finger, CCHC-type, peptidase aspartic, catalytic [Tanacetum cinerariifolium]